MATIQKYMTPNTDFMIGIIAQMQAKLVFGAQVNGWQQNADGVYLVPFDLVLFRAKRDESIVDNAKRIAIEEVGQNVALANLKGDQVGIMTDTTFLIETFTDSDINPAYISIHKKATSSKVNADAYSNNFVYSAKASDNNLKSANMQALFATPPALLRKIISNKYTVKEAIGEGLEILDPKIEIPEDSIFIAQKNLLEFVKFMREVAR